MSSKAVWKSASEVLRGRPSKPLTNAELLSEVTHRQVRCLHDIQRLQDQMMVVQESLVTNKSLLLDLQRLCSRTPRLGWKK